MAHSIGSTLRIPSIDTSAKLALKENGPPICVAGQLAEVGNVTSIVLEPTYCRVADAVAPSNVRQRFPISSALQRLSDLELGKLGLTTEPYPSIHCPLTAIGGARKDH